MEHITPGRFNYEFIKSPVLRDTKKNFSKEIIYKLDYYPFSPESLMRIKIFRITKTFMRV
jgi:hypothetical protein